MRRTGNMLRAKTQIGNGGFRSVVLCPPKSFWSYNLWWAQREWGKTVDLLWGWPAARLDPLANLGTDAQPRT